MTERSSRRHQSLPAVDIEPTIQWRRCQTRRTSAPRLGFAGSETTAGPDRLRYRHQPARELRLVRVDPASATSNANSLLATRRRDSAPEISEIGRRIVIRLTSVDGRELSLVSPRYGEQNCDAPVCRGATRRPFSSPPDHQNGELIHSLCVACLLFTPYSCRGALFHTPLSFVARDSPFLRAVLKKIDYSWHKYA